MTGQERAGLLATAMSLLACPVIVEDEAGDLYDVIDVKVIGANTTDAAILLKVKRA